CIHINTSNVRLDLHHFDILGNSSVAGGTNYGIYVYRGFEDFLTNITIDGHRVVGQEHCRIKDFVYGIWGAYLDGVTVNNITIIENDIGLYLNYVGIETVANYSSIANVNFSYS
ncbi:unnamed protein product, partial [marine sediment metagenome]